MRTRNKGDAVVAGVGWWQPMRFVENVGGGGEELVQQRWRRRGGVDGGLLGALDALPTDRLAVPMECHAPGTKIPEDRAQRCQPLSAQNHVKTCKGHDKQIGMKGVAVDGDGGPADDAHAGDAFTIRHCRT